MVTFFHRLRLSIAPCLFSFYFFHLPYSLLKVFKVIDLGHPHQINYKQIEVELLVNIFSFASHMNSVTIICLYLPNSQEAFFCPIRTLFTKVVFELQIGFQQRITDKHSQTPIQVKLKFRSLMSFHISRLIRWF